MSDFNLTDQLHLITIPTILFHGTGILYSLDDKMIDSSYASIIADGIQGSQLYLVPQAGHWLHMMAPDFIQDKLASIL
jgi:pimeloyl-ACP methyl ester carboxylesterase